MPLIHMHSSTNRTCLKFSVYSFFYFFALSMHLTYSSSENYHKFNTQPKFFDNVNDIIFINVTIKLNFFFFHSRYLIFFIQTITKLISWNKYFSNVFAKITFDIFITLIYIHYIFKILSNQKIYLKKIA